MTEQQNVAVATKSPFELASVPNNFKFIKPSKLGANEFRFDAGKNQFFRNMVELETKRIKMHIFYISPILYADTFFLFNENQEKRMQWIEIGFFDSEGKLGTICTYDNGIKSLYNAIKEMPDDVVCHQDDNRGIYLFTTIEWSGTKKDKALIDENGKASNATYFVPNFTHLPNDFPQDLKDDYKAIFENPENGAFLFALMKSYRLPNAPRFDRQTKQPIVQW
jgi:hypothetical protein